MMIPRVISIFALALLMGKCLAGPPIPTAVDWTPAEALAVIEIVDPVKVTELLLTPELVHRIGESGYYRDLAQGQNFTGMLNLIQFLESRFGLTWKELLGNLTGGGITLALVPGNRSVLFLDSLNGELLGKLHGAVLALAQYAPRGTEQTTSLKPLEYRGITGWVSREGKVHTVIGHRIVVASDETVYREVIDLQSRQDKTSLADLPAYQESLKAIGVENDGRLFLNLKSIGASGDEEESALQSSNPLDALFSAGVKEHLREADWIAAALHAKTSSLLVQALTDDHAASDSIFSAFARPKDGIPAGLEVQRRILGMSFYRDLQSFYAAKNELFPERTSGLIFFENMMGIFFSGRDFTDEVLAELEPEFQMVAARQKFEGAREPQLQLPAFAAIFRMKNPADFAPVVEEAWQKALGLLNFTRGQNADPGLIIDRAAHQGVKYTYAYFAESKPDESLDFRFNFRPALAMAGTHLILSSTDQLARDLIEASIDGGSKIARLGGAHTFVETDIRQMELALESNRESLIQQNMLKQGNARQKAESDVSLFFLLLQLISESSLKVGWNDHSPWSEFELQFDSREASAGLE